VERESASSFCPDPEFLDERPAASIEMEFERAE